ncbi:surface-adhesin E family protein [Sphingomonas sp. ID0503]|uniref:surface-adhesin E family protein n=1 Tax=Sphingomonas sp. ID0503 TaxID=3399691 RepID=UPI003AFB3645
MSIVTIGWFSGALIALVAVPASAADWQLVAEGDDGARIFIDNESVARMGDLAQAWIRTDLTEVASYKQIINQLWKIRCESNTLSIDRETRQKTVKDAASTVAIGPAARRFELIDPDSAGAIVKTTVCRPPASVPPQVDQ